MDLTKLFFVLFVVFTPTVAKVHVLDSRQRDWIDSREACREKSLTSCDLVTKAALKEEFSDLDIPSDDEIFYWVGGQRLFEWKWDESDLPLFQQHGCYQYKLEEERLRLDIKYNNPHECYKRCVRTGYLYLQGDDCYCSDQLVGAKVSEDQCNTRCVGSTDTCGGEEEIFSVYSVPEQFDVEDSDVTLACAVAEARGSPQDPKLHIESGSCADERQYFCLSELKEETLSPSKGTFRSIKAGCAGISSTVPTLTNYSAAAELAANYSALVQKLDAPTSFWLPLQRENKGLWIDGEVEDNKGSFGECLAVFKLSSSYRLVSKPCHSEYRALCDCNTITEEVDEQTNGGDRGDTNGRASASTATTVAGIVGVIVAVVFLK